MESIHEPNGKARDRDGLYKRRQYWHYELIIDGKKRSFTTGTTNYSEARKLRAKAVLNLEQGKAPSDAGRKRFDAVADEYIQHRTATVADGTLQIEKGRLKPLKRFLQNARLKDITARTIRSYQAARAAEVSNRTVNLETKLLRGILKVEGQWKRLEDDYKRLDESSESPGRALTPEQAFRLFSTAESNEDWLVAYQSSIVANDTGMRSVEVKNLKLGDLDTEHRKITIRRSKGNCGAGRTVILTNDALNAVLKLQERARNLNATEAGDYLLPFRVRNGVGYDPKRPVKSWRTAWRKLTKAAGLPGFRYHDLRHTFITNHAEMGTPLAVVQAQAGHLSKRMTELYTHISKRALEEAAAAYEERKAERQAEVQAKLQDSRGPGKSAVN